MATITITTNYLDPEAIPPRCRKPRPVLYDFTKTVQIPEAAEEQVKLAAVIGGKNLYIHAGNLYHKEANVKIPQAVEAYISTYEQEQSPTGTPLLKLLGVKTIRNRDGEIVQHQNQAIADTLDFSDYFALIKTEGYQELPLTESEAGDMLQAEADNLLLSQGVLYVRASEPVVVVDLVDTYDKYTEIRDRYAETLAEPKEPAMKMSVRIGYIGKLPYDHEKTEPFRVLGLTELEELPQHFADDATERGFNPEKAKEEAEQAIATLGVHIVEPAAFAYRATAPWLHGRFRIMRKRAISLLDTLHDAVVNSYYSHSTWYNDATAEQVNGWLLELATMNKQFMINGFELFPTNSECIEV